MDGNYSLSDIATATGNRDGMFGGNGLWFLALLFLFGNGRGFWGAGADGRVATIEDLNNSSNFARLESQVQANGTAITTAATNLGNGICQLGYQLATDVGNIEKQIADCCCQNQLASKQTQFDMANYAASINANVAAQVQSVKDMLAADKAAAQAARIQQLELQQALCGVVRFPTQATYSAGFPFMYNPCGCGCQNI